MAHHRKAIGVAVALNTGIFMVEAVAGFEAGSLALIMDSVHNFSDELALVCLYVAFIWSRGPSRTLLRSANVLTCAGTGPRPHQVDGRFRQLLYWMTSDLFHRQNRDNAEPCGNRRRPPSFRQKVHPLRSGLLPTIGRASPLRRDEGHQGRAKRRPFARVRSTSLRFALLGECARYGCCMTARSNERAIRKSRQKDARGRRRA
jgi:Cation efflux family